MTQFVQLVISGLMLGCIYGLIAMGFVIVFKATNVVNFAHASIVMLGALLVAKWHDSLGFFGAIAAAAVACALAAVVLEFVFVRPLRTHASGDDALAIMTIALNILLGTELVRVVGNDLLPSGAPWGANTTHVFGAAIPQARIGAAVVALVLLSESLSWIQLVGGCAIGCGILVSRRRALAPQE
jgi:branched-chain amino acid transport system permease protein